MITKSEIPNIKTFTLYWPNQKLRSYFIEKNIHREYIKIVWVFSQPGCIFRVYFNTTPNPRASASEESEVSWYFDNSLISQSFLPYIIFLDKGKKCYKGSITLAAIGGSTGSCTFHLAEY